MHVINVQCFVRVLAAGQNMVNMQHYIVFGFSAIALYTFVLVSLQHLISECQPGPGLIKVIYGFGLELAELIRMLKGAVAEFGEKKLA